jgi:hypothetical protein
MDLLIHALRIRRQLFLRFLTKFQQIVLAAALFVGVATFGIANNASAHVLRQANGTISGVLHIPLSDQPRAGEPSKLNVTFGDKENKFSLVNCICTMTIKQYGKILQTIELKPQMAGAALTSSSTYEFPSLGAFDIIVHAKAKAGEFREFNLAYDVDVESDARAGSTEVVRQDTSPIFLLGAGTLAGIAVFAVAGARDSGRYRPAPIKTAVPKKEPSGKK